MIRRKLGLLPAAGAAAILVFAVVPATVAAASPAGRAAPAARAAAAAGGPLAAHHQMACGRQLTVYTPRTAGTALNAAAMGLPGGSRSVLGMAAAHHVRWLSHITCKARPAPPEPKRLKTGQVTGSARSATNYFLNWAGYVDTTPSPDYVQSSWEVPLVCCDFHGPDKSSIWPGIGDGNTKGTSLIQDGTEQDVSTSDTASYYFWLETFPHPQQEITNLTPHVGDQVATSASYDTLVEGDATFVVCDLTQGACVSGTEASSPPDNKAEWIAERTEYCNGGHYWFPALAPFSVAQFSGSYFDLTGTELPADPISAGSPAASYMVDDTGETIATPGSLSDGGTAFVVVWDDYGQPQEVANTTC